MPLLCKKISSSRSLQG